MQWNNKESININIKINNSCINVLNSHVCCPINLNIKQL